MFNLTISRLHWSPEGSIEPLFTYHAPRAGESNDAMMASEVDGSFNSSEYSFQTLARCIDEVSELSQEGVPVEWDLMDIPARLALIRSFPPSWFQRLVVLVNTAAEISKEEERDSSE